MQLEQLPHSEGRSEGGGGREGEGGREGGREKGRKEGGRKRRVLSQGFIALICAPRATHGE